MVAECKACGKRILWAQLAGSGENGDKVKWVPMDTAEPIYELSKDGEQTGFEVRLIPSSERRRSLDTGEVITAVAHFATCRSGSSVASGNRR